MDKKFPPTQKLSHLVGVSENSGFSPQVIHFNRDFHDFHHPFWGTTFLGNTLVIQTQASWNLPRMEDDFPLGISPIFWRRTVGFKEFQHRSNHYICHEHEPNGGKNRPYMDENGWKLTIFPGNKISWFSSQRFVFFFEFSEFRTSTFSQMDSRVSSESHGMSCIYIYIGDLSWNCLNYLWIIHMSRYNLSEIADLETLTWIEPAETAGGFRVQKHFHRIHVWYIYLYMIYRETQPNVGKYTIHASYGIFGNCVFPRFLPPKILSLEKKGENVHRRSKKYLLKDFSGLSSLQIPGISMKKVVYLPVNCSSLVRVKPQNLKNYFGWMMDSTKPSWYLWLIYPLFAVDMQNPSRMHVF